MEMKFKRRKTYPMDDQCKLLAGVDVERNLRVDFLKLAPSRDFETSSRAVKKLRGATLTDPVLTCMHSIPDRLSTFCVVVFSAMDVLGRSVLVLPELQKLNILSEFIWFAKMSVDKLSLVML